MLICPFTVSGFSLRIGKYPCVAAQVRISKFPEFFKTLIKLSPNFILNLFYQIIATNRYKLFGKLEVCSIPNDVNNDNIRDLVVSPNTENNSENFESIMMFLNAGEDNSPLVQYTQNDFLQN